MTLDPAVLLSSAHAEVPGNLPLDRHVRRYRSHKRPAQRIGGQVGLIVQDSLLKYILAWTWLPEFSGFRLVLARRIGNVSDQLSRLASH